MRVYEFSHEGFHTPLVKSTATYTRTPRTVNAPYDTVARHLAPDPAAELSGANHRVVSGDTLTGIVRNFLQAQGQNLDNRSIYDGVRAVARSNGLANANLIHPGQDLDLSVLLEKVSARPNVDPVGKLDIAPLASLPNTTVPEAAPSDPLRDARLTTSATPVKIAARTSALGSTTAKNLPLLQDHAEVPSPPLPNKESASTTFALQQLLNGTADALSLVRDLMGGHDDDNHQATAINPWDSVLNGAARLSSEFGMRKDPFTGRLAFHDGIDLAARRGTEITALRDGEVVYSGWKGGYGNTVVVRHDDGYESIYGHTAKNLVSVGDTVSGGTVIAEVGSTGRSTGPHLHLEMRRHGKPINPLPHLEGSPIQLAQNGSGS